MGRTIGSDDRSMFRLRGSHVHFEDWYKKQVTLRWGNVRFDLDVAQELFSSHEVDSGSMLLLRSLANTEFPRNGRCLDYGCGYGILGLAWKAFLPEWDVMLVDRDALAVGLSTHNAQRLGYTVDCVGGLDPIDRAGVGYDLLLWNVPGKAGAPVLAELMVDSLDALAPNGLLALVVVHPLTGTLRDIAANRDEFAIEHDEHGPEHTVLHVRRMLGTPQAKASAFARGVFDREPVAVDRSGLSYALTPVIGLPQYDGPNHPTQLMMDALTGLTNLRLSNVICVRPGAGHLPTAVARLWPEPAITLVDRDLLAIKASSRALAQGGEHAARVTAAFASDLSDFNETEGTYDLAIVMLDHQMRAPVMRRLLDDLIGMSTPNARFVFGGSSTEVSRIIALLKRQPSLRLRSRTRRKGASMAVIERR